MSSGKATCTLLVLDNRLNSPWRSSQYFSQQMETHSVHRGWTSCTTVVLVSLVAFLLADTYMYTPTNHFHLSVTNSIPWLMKQPGHIIWAKVIWLNGVSTVHSEWDYTRVGGRCSLLTCRPNLCITRSHSGFESNFDCWHGPRPRVENVDRRGSERK